MLLIQFVFCYLFRSGAGSALDWISTKPDNHSEEENPGGSYGRKFVAPCPKKPLLHGNVYRPTGMARRPCLKMDIPETANSAAQNRALWLHIGWLLAFFFCLGAFLRIYNFWVVDLVLDEYGTWWSLATGDWGGVIHRVISVQGQSPLYYFIVKLSSDLLGVGTFSLRLPSVLFGIGAIGLAYPLGLRVFQDRHAALLSVASLAVNEMLISYSQDARPYAFAVFCAMLSFFFYVSLLQSEKLPFRFGYVLATAATFYAHYLFGFIVVIQTVYLFMTLGWSWLSEKGWRWTFLALALVCIPGGRQFVGLFARRGSLNWIPLQPWFAPVKLAVEFLDPWVFSATALVVIAVRFGNPKGKTHDQHRGLFNLILLWLLLPFLCFGLLPPLFGLRLVEARYVLCAAPAAAFIMAWLMARGRGAGRYQWLPLGVFLIVSFAHNLAPALRATGNFGHRYNQGWAKAAKLLATFGQSDDLILVRTGFVEGDLLARSDPNPLLVSFVRWPLTAHLPAGDLYKMADLPFHADDQTLPYISSLLSQAAKYRRLWMIDQAATSPMIPDLARTLHNDLHFSLRQQIIYDQVRVLVLERDGK